MGTVYSLKKISIIGVMMEKVALEVVTILVGINLIVFRKSFVELVILTQKQMFGDLFDTEKKRNAGLRTIPIFGSVLVGVGLIGLLKLI